MAQPQKQHVTPRMMQNIWFVEQNIWSRVALLARSKEATLPELRQQVDTLAKVYSGYLAEWERLQEARQKDGISISNAGLLTPLMPVFKMQAQRPNSTARPENSVEIRRCDESDAVFLLY